MRKRFLIVGIAVAILLLVTLGIIILVRSNNLESQQSQHIVTSFYPVFFLTREIVGNRMDVVNLTPAGVEPHDYELTPKNVSDIETAILTVVVGGVEHWIDSVPQDSLLKVGKDIQTSNDPHIWLDPLLAIQMSQAISLRLQKIDPVHAKEYKERTEILVKKLDALDTDFRNSLKTCKLRTLVTSHSAWAYLASRYGLVQVPIAGLDPEQEPSAKDLSNVITTVKQQNVKTVFFESLTSSKLAETIAKETGVDVLELNPLEGLTTEQERQHDDYFTIQHRNLEQLRKGLACP